MRKQTSRSSARHRARKALVREEMQFLLQRDERRFSKQLQARMLDEGCNLPLALARPIFCEKLVSSLSAELPPAQRSRLEGRRPSNGSETTHPRFHEAVRFFLAHLPDAESALARASIEATAAVRRAWRLDIAFLTADADRFEEELGRIVDRLCRSRPHGRLSALRLAHIRRRLYLALTASLLRYVRDPDSFRAEFAAVPDLLGKMRADRGTFTRAMAFFAAQTPYFVDIASRTFWRTLAALDTEEPSASES